MLPWSDVMRFSAKQGNKLQARYFLTAFLSKMGINRTMASLGGMNVIHLETEQAVEHIKLMVSHLRKEDMLQMSIDQQQIQVGTSWAVLSRPGKKARMYVDPCYASHTWAFLEDRIGSHI
jgi:hypothetical protein